MPSAFQSISSGLFSVERSGDELRGLLAEMTGASCVESRSSVDWHQSLRDALPAIVNVRIHESLRTRM